MDKEELKGNWIYQHTLDGEVVYIGKGSGYNGQRSRDLGRSNKEHVELLRKGALDISIIIHGLEHHESYSYERILIDELQPKFNTMYKAR